MKESKRLLDLVSQMNDEPEPEAKAPGPKASRQPRAKTKAAVEDTPHGERGDFFKLTISVSPEVYDLFADEVARRKKARQKGATVSAIIREMALKCLARATE
jgi:hypothetical protein